MIFVDKAKNNQGGGQPMKEKFAMLLGVNLEEGGFSLDELVFRTKELFEKEGMVGFLRCILILLDQLVYLPSLGKQSKKESGCCASPYFVVSQQEEKLVFTSCGKLRVRWTRIRCKHCKKSFIPLRSFLNVESYQRKTSELEKIVTEVVSEQSYRRTSQHLETIGSIPVPHTTLHRWVMKSDCDEIDPKKRVQTIIADGTGFKQKPHYREDKSNRGEVKVMVGITKDGTILPYGAWTEESWRKIGNQVKKANHSSDKLMFKPIAKCLVSDGEEKLINGLKKLTEDTQRCVWHVPHDLGPLLKYKDGATKEATREFQSDLATMIDIKLPPGDYQKVKLEDKLNIEKKTWEAERKLKELIQELKDRGYKTAATYLNNAREKMFTYVRLWLRSGIIHPRVSSMVERMMREIGRRIKKIGFGWSPKGAAKMTRIIIKRITSANEWDEYWHKRLGFNGNVKLSFLGCQIM
jgi:hypothetical protein